MKKFFFAVLFILSISSVFAGKYDYCSECVDEYELYKNEQKVSKYAQYEVGQYIYITEEKANFQIQFIFSSGKAILRKWIVEDGKIKIKKIKISL